VNSGVAASRAAWADLPKDVRASAWRGTAALDVAIVAVAYGRWLMGWAIRVLTVLGAGIMLWFVAVVAAPDLAGAGLIVLICVMFLTFALIKGGDRLLRRNLATVAGHPGSDLPAEMRLGTRGPRLQLAAVAGFLVGAAITLVMLSDGSWDQRFKEAVAVLAAIVIVWAGPSALGLEVGVLDGAGLRLDLAGVLVPWASIGSVRVGHPGRVVIEIAGPVVADAGRSGRWTRSARRRLRPGKSLQIAANRPELAVWISGEYHRPADIEGRRRER
jgi:hypothetical protein